MNMEKIYTSLLLLSMVGAAMAGCAGPDPGAAPGAAGADGVGGPGGPGGSGAAGTAGSPGIPPGGLCPGDLEHFDKELWQPLLAKKCIACHQTGGLAKDSALVLAPATAPGHLETNFQRVAALAKVQQGGASALLSRPAGQHPDGHPGGTLTPPGSDGYARLSSFIDRVVHGVCDDLKPEASCTEVTPGRRRLRRLTRSEYDRTLRDLFSLPPTFTAGLATDTVVNGFDNNADALLVSPLLAEQLRKTSEQVAALVVKQTPACTGDAAACADGLLQGQGRRIFRRPLTADERARYGAVFAAIAQEEGIPVATEATLSALLQSPHFLYRSELGADAAAGLVTLTPHELATELSYLLWGTTPDEALLAAADQGTLATPQGLSAQVERLLTDPRSSVALDDFVAQWLDLGRLGTVAKDAATYPTYDAPLRAAMAEETRRFVDHVVREQDGTLGELLSARYAFVGGPLADLYGVSGSEWQKVSLDGTHRAGILTQASVLAVHGSPSGSSPINRGRLVRERLFCQPLPPPPPNLNVEPPPVDPSLSTRERFAAHSTVEPCVSCHKLVDPIGFGFERFDGIGKFRDLEAGKPIDATGAIHDSVSTDGAFDGAVELADRLAQSAEVRSCFATQWVRYGYGIDEVQEGSCMATKLREGYAAGDGGVRGLLRALITAPHFATRQADPEANGGSGAGGSGAGGSAGAGGSGVGGDGAGGAAAGSGAGGSGAAGGTGGEALEVKVTVDSQWDSGSCSTVVVTNTGAQKVTWQIELDVGGTLSDVWNATATPGGGKVQFVGVSWNASLAPGGNASFGFCMKK
jgi:hypothetical protein